MTTFDPWAYLRILDIQAFDTALDQIAHKLKNLPEIIEAEKLRAQFEQLKYREVAGITEVADRELDVRKAESDVDQVRMRLEKDSQLLNSGSISDSKQLTELQHEVDSLKRRQNLLEDEEISILQQLEDAQKNLDSIRVELARVTQELQKADELVTIRVANIESEREKIASERIAESKSVPEELLKLYEKVRTDNRGIGASRFSTGQCEGCRIQFSNADLNKFKNAADGELLRCEECRAILVKS
ncbi:MAG: C4-type zinc ribbon domain-containing protein [Actinobacteria bacterium]|nr:C4-type zinc ribbon domain-containing protein [Actinomycetota bacterium]